MKERQNALLESYRELDFFESNAGHTLIIDGEDIVIKNPKESILQTGDFLRPLWKNKCLGLCFFIGLGQCTKQSDESMRNGCFLLIENENSLPNIIHSNIAFFLDKSEIGPFRVIKRVA